MAFELLHMNVWGKFHTPTHNGHNYFLTIVDDYSRVTWVFIMNNETEVHSKVKQFFINIKTQFSANTKIVRFGNGTEFLLTEFQSMIKELGIHHQQSCVYTP